MTPPLLLDVDGVLDALVAELPAGWRREIGNGYTMSWDPTITARLAGWHEAGRVEIQWLTTWGQPADLMLAESMGLPRGLHTHRRPDGKGPTGYTSGLAGAPSWWWPPTSAPV